MAATGSVWATGVWADPVWAAGVWADAVAPAPQSQQPTGGWDLRFLNPRVIRTRDEDEEREVTVEAAEVPALIEKIKSAAETRAERKQAARAAELLSKTQPVIDLDAPWARQFVAQVLMAYMAEREMIRRQQEADDTALIMLLM